MGSSYFTDPIEFILTTLIDLYMLAVALRFLLQWVRADFYNQLSQALVKITNPPLIPLRRILPGFGGVDFASLVLLFVLAWIKHAIVFMLKGVSAIVAFPTISILSIASMLDLFLNIFLFSILIQVILSWVAPNQYNPITMLLYQLTDPLLKPARRLIPPMGGLDLSPMAVMMLIYVTKMMLIRPLEYMAF